ncbi:hypothetical protein RSOLAG22IIIB_05341 [Rhizoctonia solani]|uniref:DUF6532 domain-containing protein n=1 Tax=Rhizoctonia solani TaxID=456999 RepID=A0A0K6G4Q1_9AGAM|nr:hypothetical protein RSOLAG22IIIB_05341 [Rhizoctonia solani]
MSDITTSKILAQVEKASAIQTSPTNLPGTTGTPSRTEADPQTKLRRSNCSLTRSTRAKEGGYDKKLAANKQRAARAQRTHSRNEKFKTSHTHSEAESISFGFTSAPSETGNDSQDPSRSPTPIATTDEPEAQPTRSNLKEKLTWKFDQVLNTSGTQTLMVVDDAISADPVYASQSEEQDFETRFLSLVLVGAGGGFHLDHPSHRPGNSRTYCGSKGSPRTIAVPNSPVPTESTQPEDHSPAPYIQHFPNSERGAPLPPVHYLDSQFFAAPEGSRHFLGYPDDQRSASPTLPDNNLARSQSPAHSPTPSLSRELLSDGSSRRNRPPHHDDSATHISTSSKSLGDPIPKPPLASNRLSQSTEQHATQPEGHTQSSTPTQSQGKRPLETPSTPLRPHKRRAMTFGTTTGVSRRRTTSTQTRKKGKSTPRARAQTPTPIVRPQMTYDDNLDLLEDLDEGQLVVDSAKQGVLIESRNYRKPTAQDLIGHERGFWKDTSDLTWAFSMGEGNFQTGAVYASWASACYSKVVGLKLPDLDTTAMTMSDNMMTVVLNNLCNMRYRDYLRLCEPVRNYYQLKNPSTPDEREDTKEKVDELYPDYFHYREINDPADPYEGQILYIALESTFFSGPNSIGAKYPALFRRSEDNPKDERKHLAVLAYLATMVQFCLGEWTKGYFKKGTLNATTQHSVWLCHFEGLKNVSIIARKWLIRTYNRWVQKAYDASQAQTKFSKKHYVQAVVRQKDVRLDTPSRSPSPLDDH